MAEFQRVEIQTEARAMLDEGIEKLEEELAAKGVVGYVPNEADLEIIILGIASQFAADAAVVASTLLDAAFRKYGVELLKLAYNEGQLAKAPSTWTLLEEGGKYAAHTIEAGTQLEAGGLAFYVESNVTVLEGESTKTVQLVASERGTEYNGVSGTAALVNNLSYVSTVVIVGETTEGKNQESDEEYMERLASILKLQAPRPIIAANYAEMVLYGSSGVTVGRATAINGYNPATIKITAKTNSSTILTEVSTFTGVSLESSSLPQKHPGSMLHYEGDSTYAILPRNTTAVSKKAATEMIISPAALESKAAHNIEVIGKYEEPRWVTVFVAAANGTPLSAPERATLLAYLESYRELNFKIAVEEANYNEIQVKATVHCLPGYTESAVVANVKAAIENYLSPANWGNPTGTTTGSKTWLNATEAYGVVRYNSLVGVIESVSGVQYVPKGSAGLAIGLAEAPGSKVEDLALVGPAPLTETKAANITVTAV